MTLLDKLVKLAAERVTDMLSDEKAQKSDFTGSTKQLDMGIDMERKEHGPDGPEGGKHDITQNSPEAPEEIAKAHLAEIPDYYTRLEKMEEAVEKSASVLEDDWANAHDSPEYGLSHSEYPKFYADAERRARMKLREAYDNHYKPEALGLMRKTYEDPSREAERNGSPYEASSYASPFWNPRSKARATEPVLNQDFNAARSLARAYPQEWKDIRKNEGLPDANLPAPKSNLPRRALQDQMNMNSARSKFMNTFGDAYAGLEGVQNVVNPVLNAGYEGGKALLGAGADVAGYGLGTAKDLALYPLYPVRALGTMAGNSTTADWLEGIRPAEYGPAVGNRAPIKPGAAPNPRAQMSDAEVAEAIDDDISKRASVKLAALTKLALSPTTLASYLDRASTSGMYSAANKVLRKAPHPSLNLRVIPPEQVPSKAYTHAPMTWTKEHIVPGEGAYENLKSVFDETNPKLTAALDSRKKGILTSMSKLDKHSPGIGEALTDRMDSARRAESTIRAHTRGTEETEEMLHRQGYPVRATDNELAMGESAPYRRVLNMQGGLANPARHLDAFKTPALLELAGREHPPVSSGIMDFLRDILG